MHKIGQTQRNMHKETSTCIMGNKSANRLCVLEHSYKTHLKFSVSQKANKLENIWKAQNKKIKKLQKAYKIIMALNFEEILLIQVPSFMLIILSTNLWRAWHSICERNVLLQSCWSAFSSCLAPQIVDFRSMNGWLPVKIKNNRSPVVYMSHCWVTLSSSSSSSSSKNACHKKLPARVVLYTLSSRLTFRLKTKKNQKC